ncbi:MAG: anthranilate synthase component 1 [Gammaproteobacteria bacterium]|nr:anthranilate synthase component 1 [Gammaproteobacteria bacterium]
MGAAIPQRETADVNAYTVLSRRLAGTPDPLGVYALVDDECCALFETADAGAGEQAESLIFLDACVSLTAHGDAVRMQAHTAPGEQIADRVAGQMPAAHTQRDPDNRETRFRFASPAIGKSEALRLKAASVLDPLRALTAGSGLGEVAEGAQNFVFGCFAYDLIAAFESVPISARQAGDFPDYSFHLAGSVIRVDHRHARTEILVLAPKSDTIEARRRLTALTRLCEQAEPYRPRAAKPVPARLAQSDKDYAEVVARCKRHIRAGDVYQIVPSRAWDAPCDDPLAAYARLRKANPSPYMFYLNDPAGTLFGASPESALKVDAASRRVGIRPIAGTRPRGEDADSDSRLELELRLSQKEVAEHVMLVDLARNDVARVSAPGTRRVTELMRVERYSCVMHLVSRVEGSLAPGLDALHAYRATLNMGTLTGAPKLKAAELLAGIEPARRGPYGGAVGYLTATGDLDTAIVIRSALVQNGVARVQAGAGVVADSEPLAEAAETRRKARAVLEALGVEEERGDE